MKSNPVDSLELQSLSKDKTYLELVGSLEIHIGSPFENQPLVVADITRLTEEELREIRQIGPKKIALLREVLRTFQRDFCPPDQKQPLPPATPLAKAFSHNVSRGAVRALVSGIANHKNVTPQEVTFEMLLEMKPDVVKNILTVDTTVPRYVNAPQPLDNRFAEVIRELRVIEIGPPTIPGRPKKSSISVESPVNLGL